jgi:hypothetical protein
MASDAAMPYPSSETDHAESPHTMTLASVIAVLAAQTASHDRAGN